MEEIILEFRKSIHREDPNLLDEGFVNNFMLHHNICGQETFDLLVEELNKL